MFVFISEMKAKGGTLDAWSAKEKLALGCSVQRSGDQNWSVLDWSSYIYIYMTKCQKVRKSWVKILTVNKI